MVIDIVDGRAIVTGTPSGDRFVNKLIDACELMQQAEQCCPDVLRHQTHRLLLEITTLICETAAMAAVKEDS